MVEAECEKWLKTAENCRKHQIPINRQEFTKFPFVKSKVAKPLEGRIKMEKYKW